MTVNELLRHDNTYVPLSWYEKLILGKRYKKYRKAYVKGVRGGWENAVKAMESSCHIPNNLNIPESEYRDVMSLLSALGYQFFYINNPTINEYPGAGKIHPGLNLCRNKDALDAGVVVSDEVKGQIFQLLRKNSDPRLWK